MSEAMVLNTREREKRNGVMKKVLFIVVVVLICVLILEVLFYTVLSSKLTIRKVHLESEVSIANEEVLRIAGIRGKEYYYMLNTDEIRMNLENHPLVRKAYVEKSFPDTVNIVLYARKPLGAALLETEQGSVPVVFDAEGVIFQIGTADGMGNLPILSGVQFQNVHAGLRMPETLLPMLKNLNQLRQTNPGLFEIISELKVNKCSNGDIEYTVYPVNHPVRIRIGSELNENVLKYAMMVLDVARERAQDMDEIDFRTGEVVYRAKEENISAF